MVRKSERNKASKAETSEKPPTGRKRGRPRKKSESESEVEAEACVDKDTMEVGEISESSQQIEVDDPDSKQEGVRSRRSTRRHPVPSDTDKEPEHDQNSEWKEDPVFWGQDDSAPVRINDLNIYLPLVAL